MGRQFVYMLIFNIFNFTIVILYVRKYTKKEATTMKKKLSNIISKLPLSKIQHVLGMLVYYLFGKISNGLLFILVGSVGLTVGLVFNFPVVIALGAAVAISGLVLSFFRENRYIDATNEIKKLKNEQRSLKESVGLLNGRVDLLKIDLIAAQAEINKLRGMKMVEYSVDGKLHHSAKGKSGPAFSEHPADKLGYGPYSSLQIFMVGDR